MYKSLYRKWRPKTFDDVIDQEHVTKILKNEVLSKRISHAYLFTGSRGTGKTTCAKILAKAINCENPVDGNPCGNCETCKNIESGSCLDIVEIDAASNNGVENIRDMREEIVFTPSSCKFRVYIVDEVHMLSPGAFNAFLKTLEEPPPHVVFILATTELQKLPLTIISRCQKFKFYRISRKCIEKRIEYICEKENIKIEKPAISLISNSSDGAMRDALSILDQCRSCSKDLIDENSVRETLGISDEKSVIELISFIVSGNCTGSLEKIEEVYKQSGNMLKLCEEVTNQFRNLMIYKITDSLPKEENLLEINKKISLKDSIHCLDMLQKARKNMTTYSDKKLEMETTAVKLCLNFLNIESDLKKNKTNKLQENTVHSENKNITKNENTDYWHNILEEMKKNSSLKSLYISLKNSKAHKEGNYILIESENSMAFEFLKKLEFRTALKNIISIVLGRPYSIGPYKKIEIKNDEISPLDILIKNAKSSNIEVKINQEENKK